MNRSIVLLGLAGLLGSTLGCTDEAQGGQGKDVTPIDDQDSDAALRDVVVVSNSISGTVSFLDGHTFGNLGSVDVIPDLAERLEEIYLNPVRLAAYYASKKIQKLKHFEPENAEGDRFADDVVVSPDGKTLYVSRSNLGDVAAFDLTEPGHPMRWVTRVDGFRADHIALSPDGDRLLVSASTAKKVDVFDTLTGLIVATFPGGFAPHQNDYSANGERIYNGSTGNVALPYALNALKGARQLTIVDAETLEVVAIHEFDRGVRPTVITSDEMTMYAQLSHLNGVIRFDLTTGQITHTLEQPFSEFAIANYPTFDDYPHDSAHHGLALSGDGTRLCDAGTIDNAVMIVATATMSVETTIDVGMLPYWATTSVDGNHCMISVSGDDEILIIDYSTGEERARVPVGRFPLRNRLGRVPEIVVGALSPSPG